MRGSPPLARKLAALSLAALVVAAAWLAVFSPIRAAFVAVADERAELLVLRDRYASAGDRRGALGDRRDRLLRAETQIEGLIDAPNAASAAAAMQTAAKEVVEDAGGQVRRVVVLEPNADDALQRVGLRVLATIGASRLEELFSALELEGRPYRLGRVQIQANSAARSAAERRILTIQFDVFGYRRVSAVSAGLRRRSDG